MPGKKRTRDESFSPSKDPPSSKSSVALSDSGDEAMPPSKASALLGDQAQPAVVMRCTLPPHRDAIDFSSIDAFEVHYAKDHLNRCSTCGKNFPSARFMALHLDEHHNPLRAEQEVKGEKTYACFVEDCEKLCSNASKRRLHLIDKHAFPKIYNFRIVQNGIDRTASMLTEPTSRRRVSTSAAPADSVTRQRRRSSQVIAKGVGHENVDPDVPEQSLSTKPSPPLNNAAKASQQQIADPTTELVNSMSALQFVPPSVTRQQGKQRAS